MFPTFTPVFSKTTPDGKVLDRIFNVKIQRKENKKRFKLLEGVNRPADHVNSQVSAVRQLGILRPVVVAKFEFNGKLDHYIIDGQNLYAALTKLGYDVPYIEINIESDEDLIQAMALVNTSAKAWTMNDYIRAWSYTRKDYTVLAHYIKSHTIEKSAVASILFGYHGVSHQITRMIKNGLFRVKDEARAAKILKLTEDVIKNAPKLDRSVNRVFVSGYLTYLTKYYNQYNHLEFLKYLKKNAQLLVQANDRKIELVDEFFQKLKS